MTYVNLPYNTFLKGIETILETEFDDTGVSAVISKDPVKGKSQHIRIWQDEGVGEFLEQRTKGQTHSYDAEIVCSVMKRVGMEDSDAKAFDLAARAAKVLSDNHVYRKAGAYQWHAGGASVPEYFVSDEEEGVRFIYNVTISGVT